MEWKPIDSAPKDRAFLGWSPDEDPYGEANGIAIVEWEERDQEFQVLHDSECFTWQYYKPTHWMPLPEPPSDSKPQESS